MRRHRPFSLLSVALAGAISCADDTPAPGPKPPPPPVKGAYDDVPVTARVKIDRLTGPVDVVRDRYGMVHIRATTLEDALRVQGYQAARDRTAQLELIRRSATGRMAEILGDAAPSLIDSDIAMRHVGLARAARQMLANASPEIRAWLEAYADGISQFNARAASGEEELPAGMLGLSQQAFQPWTAEDVLAVARLQAFNLGYDATAEIANSQLVANARAKMSADSSDPKLQKRANILNDVLRFAPLENATPLADFPNDVQNTQSSHANVPPKTPADASRGVPAFRASREALEATRAYRSAIAEVHRLFGDKVVGTTGSNNWVVAPSLTESGHAMLASDPHLTLSAPAVFWMVHVTVDAPQPGKALDFAGLSFPGLPGIILGFNANVAWGATTADYDVTDVYEETLTPDGNAVKFKGDDVPIQKVRETIKIAGGRQLDYDVLVVPHHGPIVPNITPEHTVAPPSGKALSVKWTGHAATNDVNAVFGLLRAKNVDDARAALQDFAVGAQNWVVADTSGNIFYTTHSLVPRRDPAAFKWDPTAYKGTIPCLVLPGDGTAEWTGKFLEDAYIPHVKNPRQGYLATANTEQVASGLDNDPTNQRLPNGEAMYMACWHDPGFRLARIQDRIEHLGRPMTLDAMAKIQADARSASGAKLAPKLLEALAHLDDHVSGKVQHPDLAGIVASDRYKAASARLGEVKALLAQWADLDYVAASGMTPDNAPAVDANEIAASRATTIFNAWMVQMFHRVLDDEAKVLATNAAFDWRRVLIWLMTADPTQLKTYDASLPVPDSILFDDLDTPEIESRDERAITSLLDALEFLEKRLGSDTTTWRWGRLHTIRFKALVGVWSSLSIPPVPDAQFPDGFPRHGDGYNVDVAGYPLPPALHTPAAATASFAYAHGPTQRFVIDMDPSGPVARNVLPGGNVWDSRSDHFRDEAERWRRNENRPVPFAAKDVVEAAEGRVVYQSTP
jgi:penicillin amidase